jgi:hypothetical protein
MLDRMISRAHEKPARAVPAHYQKESL